MRFCVNCGNQYNELAGICPECYSDQLITNEKIEFELSKYKSYSFNSNVLNFRYPGEKAALTLSIVISVIILFIIGAVSFGLFFLILIINLLYLRINHLSFQKNMIRVSDSSFKIIDRLVKVAAFRLQIPLPDVYVTEDPQYNAYTMGFYNYGFIVINSSMVKDFKPSEILFVIGHEMGHMKRYHTTWLNLLQPARAGGTSFIFAPIMKIIFNVWSVKAEYTADQAGLIACRDLTSAVSCLLKLAGGTTVMNEVDISDFLESKENKEDLASGVLEYIGTHPFIKNRIKQLVIFSKTPTYKNFTLQQI
jgi:Zn-dependent protease with chaperone function